METPHAGVVNWVRDAKRALARIRSIVSRAMHGPTDDERLFRLLLVELKALHRQALLKTPTTAIANSIGDEIAAFELMLREGGSVHRHDLLKIELAIAEVLPTPGTKARLEQCLAVVAQMLPPGQFSPWEATVRDVARDEPHVALRTAIGRLYRRVTLSPAAERARGKLTLRALLVWLPLTCAAPLLSLLLAAYFSSGSLAAMVALISGSDAWALALLVVVGFWAGAGGATISLIRRIHRIPVSLDPIAVRLHIEASRGTLAPAPAIGGLSAVILIGLVASGLLGGEVMPGTEVFDGEGDAASLAKLLIWCFVAGFAEKFVPDAIDRLAGGSRAGGDAESTMIANRGSVRVPEPSPPVGTERAQPGQGAAGNGVQQAST